MYYFLICPNRRWICWFCPLSRSQYPEAKKSWPKESSVTVIMYIWWVEENARSLWMVKLYQVCICCIGWVCSKATIWFIVYGCGVIPGKKLTFYLLLLLSQSEPYGTLKPKAIVGEMGVLYNQTRAATIEAKSESVMLYRVHGDTFKAVLNNQSNDDPQLLEKIDQAINQGGFCLSLGLRWNFQYLLISSTKRFLFFVGQLLVPSHSMEETLSGPINHPGNGFGDVGRVLFFNTTGGQFWVICWFRSFLFASPEAKSPL